MIGLAVRVLPVSVLSPLLTYTPHAFILASHPSGLSSHTLCPESLLLEVSLCPAPTYESAGFPEAPASREARQSPVHTSSAILSFDTTDSGLAGR